MVIQGPVLDENITANNTYVSSAYYWSHSFRPSIHFGISSDNYPSRETSLSQMHRLERDTVLLNE